MSAGAARVGALHRLTHPLQHAQDQLCRRVVFDRLRRVLGRRRGCVHGAAGSRPLRRLTWWRVRAGIAVTFTSEFGDLPLLVEDTNNLNGGTLGIAETQTGTKEDATCSNRGICCACAARRALASVGSRAVIATRAATSTGLCSCFDGYVASDGYGNLGSRNDCGHLSTVPL